MRKLVSLAALLALLGLAFGGCTDAGDPFIPGEAGVSATVRLTDLVGDWDNLHVSGDLTGGAPRAMTRDGIVWSASISGRRWLNRSGSICTSSITTSRSRCCARKSSGSANCARSAGRSRSRNSASGCCAAVALASVVLPTWRGPSRTMPG